MTAIQPQRLVGCFLVAVTFAACKTGGGSGSSVKGLEDSATLRHRADGQFDVVCTDGRQEVDTLAQVQTSQVCLTPAQTQSHGLLQAGLYETIKNDQTFNARCDMQIDPVYDPQNLLVKAGVALKGAGCDGRFLTLICSGQGPGLSCTGQETPAAEPLVVRDIGEHSFSRQAGQEPKFTYATRNAPTVSALGRILLKAGTYLSVDRQAQVCADKVEVYYNGDGTLSHLFTTETDDPNAACAVSGRQHVFACLHHTPGSEACESRHGTQLRAIDTITPGTFTFVIVSGERMPFRLNN